MVYFQNKNPNLDKFLEGPAMDDVGRFYVHLVDFTTRGYILWAFGLFSSYLVHFGMLQQEKSGNPADESRWRFKVGPLQQFVGIDPST
jgi:hypothetical protein